MKPSRPLLIVILIGGFAVPFTGLVPGWTVGLATVVYLNALSAIGLNLIFGATGMLTLGHAAFMVVPVYCAGILDSFGVPFYLSVCAGLAFTFAMAKLTGSIFVRLPGIYLAVGTLGFAYVVEGIARAFPSFSGGSSGLILERGRGIGDFGWYTIAVTTLAVGTVVYVRLIRGAFWRRLRTINHDELAAGVLGIDVGKSKEHVFLLGAAFAAVAGLLKAYYVGIVIPEDGGVDRSMELLAMVMLGGSGYLFGPLLGTALLQWLFVITGRADGYVLLIYGTVFLVAVLYLKEGVAGWLAKGWHWIELTLDGPDPNVSPMAITAPSIAERDDSHHSGVSLSASGISKRFEGVVALDGVSFSVNFGEIFTIVGPNGAGKSTLFNIVSGIEAPTSGTIKLAEKNISSFSVSERARFIGRSFQVARLVPDLTVVENITVRLDQIAADLSESQRSAIAYEQISAFGLSSVAGAAVGRLSAGQQKLVDVTRAAAGNPALVLLDEPAVGLSADELDHLKSLLLKLQARGTAVVIVEHNIDFVAEVAKRGIVLDGGRPIAFGEIKEILADQKVREAYFGALG